MITTNNIKAVLDSLTYNQVREVFYSPTDYVCMILFVFNTGFTVDVHAMDYCEETEQEAVDTGNVFCDKDTFLQLIKDS